MNTKVITSLLLTHLFACFFCASTYAQTEPVRPHKEWIQFYLEDIKQEVDSLGYTEVRKRLVAENNKNQTGLLSKENYYQQLALLKVMLEKERNNFITSEDLLYESYEDYLRSQQRTNGIKSKIHNKEIKNDNFLFSGLEKTPTHKECAHLTDNYERKSCLKKKITEHISKKYDAKEAENIVRKNKLLENGKDTYVRTFVEFRINKKGKIENVKGTSVNDELTKLGEHVIKKLPRLDPGVNKGKKISVIYTVPITIMVPAEN